MSPTLAVIFLVALPLYMQQIGVVDPQFASPVVLSGPLAIQVFKRPMEAGGGEFAELGCEKLL